MSTISSYTGDGSTTQFDITFSYDTSDQVHVEVDGVDVSFSFVNASRVQCATAPAAGTTVRIYRKTDVSIPKVDFSDGAIIRADDLDAGLNQVRWRTEELGDKSDDLTTRTLKVPVGETAGQLPAQADRINKLASYDANGNPSAVDLAVAGPALASVIETTDGSNVQAWLDTFQNRDKAVVSVAEYAVSGVVTVASFRSALTALAALGGGVLRVPSGNYSLPSADLATGLQLPANTTIDLGGSTITITGTDIVGGSSTGALFEATDVSNVTIRNGIVIGNSQANNYNNGAFFNCKLTSAATADITNIRVENVEMQNFKANWWLLVHNANASHEIVTVRLTDIRAISAPGNSQNPAAIGYNAYAIMVFGETNYIKDVVVSAPYVEATYIKGGVTFKDYVLDGTIRNATILSAGATGGADDSGSYAIGCYNSGATMGNITIESPTIHAPRDCGIYAASADRLSIVNPRINGQTSMADTSLPKGAIALNSCTNVSIEGGGLEDNWTDLMIVAHVANQNITVSGLRCTGSGEATGHTGGALAIKPSIAGASGYTFANCLLDTANGGRAVFVANRAATYVSDLTFDTCRIVGRVTFGLDLNAYGEASPGDDIRLLGCYLAGANTALRATQGTGFLQIDGCEFVDVGGATALLAQLDNATQVVLTNSRFRNMGAGYAISATATIGVLQNLSFHNIANIASATSIGLGAPTHSGYLGNFIQNLAPAAGSVEGWTCMGGTTWKATGSYAA